MPLAPPPAPHRSPFGPPPQARSGPHRRTVLLSAAGVVTGAALTTGCTDDSAPARGTPQERSAADRTRARAAQDSADLVARYDAVVAAHPPLGARLAPLRAEVARHATAFGGAHASPAPSKTPSKTAATGSATGNGAGSTAKPRQASQVPASEKDALTMLASAERTLADRRVTQLLDAPGELARLLASVAAAGAAHAYLLAEDDK